MPGRIPWKAIVGIVGLIIAAVVVGNMFTYVDAGEYVVKQTIGGQLSVFETPGFKWQGLAKVTPYPKATQFDFDMEMKQQDDAKEYEDTSRCLPIRFNDQGRARICGTLRVDVPGGKQLIKLHEQFGSIRSIMSGLVAPAIAKATYQTGPLMSSRESASEKRGDLQDHIVNQAKVGFYKKVTKEVKVEDPSAPMSKDPNTGELKVAMKLVKISEPVLGKDGTPVIQEKSALAKFGISFYNFAIKRIAYSKSVQDQIEKQREREVAIQTAIAQAKKAEQDAKTAKANEEADVAKKRAEMQVDKIEAVTQAEKTRDVAALNLEKAELDAKAVIATGKAEAEARRLKMQADGALNQKLEAWIKVSEFYAQALAQAKPGALVPNLMMCGGEGGKGKGGANDLVQLLTAQTARQLSVDTQPK